jgi:site-specific DNA-methyltransferase (adenine-specific)
VKPYYEHADSTIYHGRCEDVLPTLADASVDLVLTDPPYFRVKGEWWDRQWDSADGFLSWIDGLAAQWRRVLRPNGSLYVFASPEMAARVEVTLRRRFNVLNRIRWVKEEGWHNKAEIAAQRSYLSPWEEIVFAEQYGSDRGADDTAGYGEASRLLHKDVYGPLGAYIRTERERAGLTRSEVEVALGYVSSADPKRGTALCYRWEEGSSLPTAEAYERLRALLNERGKKPDGYADLRKDYEYLRKDYEDLRKDYEDLRRPFALGAGRHTTDVWRYATVPPYPGKHPCEKPLALLQDIIAVATRPGAVVLDCCMGSGNTLRAAKYLGRQGIGIEVERRWCDATIGRLRQCALDFGAEVPA